MNKFIPIVVILCIGISLVSCKFIEASEETIFNEFQNFMKSYNRKYTTIEEFKIRFNIFKQNYNKIDMHRQFLATSNKTATYELGINEFADLTPSEFAKTHLNLEISHLQRIRDNSLSLKPNYMKGTAPESHDWREKGVVSRVKNQGSCGSCWAFSAIGNIESMYAMKTGKVIEFSEQQLVDCDKVDKGCNGGLPEPAFKYLNTSGVMTEADYSYKGRGGNCKFDQSKIKARVNGYHFAGTEDENQLKQLLFENGPFAIGMNATPLQLYFWGIFRPWFSWICNPNELNHGVLLVGYGVQNGTPYWIIKNSWGPSWGEKGYFRIIAGEGACGLNTYVISAEVSDI